MTLRKILLLLAILLWAQPIAVARSQSPPIKLKSLQVELWPEYDQPETLVIYRAELAPTTPLPVQVTFRLPGHITDFHVVAIEQEGVLVEVDRETLEWRSEGDERLLTFSTPAPKIQFEYYDPKILTIAGQKRQLRFDFVAPYEVETATFQAQEPVQAENFVMTPPPTSTFTGNDGLKYDTVQAAGLNSGEAFSLTASYDRNTDELSAPRLQSETAEHAPDLSVAPAAPPNQNSTFGYALIGIGAVLLLGVGGYWWWTQRMNRTAARPGRKTIRPTSRRKRQVKTESIKVAGQPQPAVASTISSGFCYRCGASLRDDANFCHVCGAERRK
jgi:hypothetical protein